MNSHEMPILNQQIITHTHEVTMLNQSNIHQITHILVQPPMQQQQQSQPQISQPQHVSIESRPLQSQSSMQSEHTQQSLQSHQQQQSLQNQQVLHMQSQQTTQSLSTQQCQTQQPLQSQSIQSLQSQQSMQSQQSVQSQLSMPSQQPLESQLPMPSLLKVRRESSPVPLDKNKPEFIDVNLLNIKKEPRTDKKPKTEKQKEKVKDNKKKKEAIDSQAREIIFKVIKFFESEKLNRGYSYPVENVVKRACAATGLSESTIKRIKRDGRRAEATQTRMTGPKKKRIRKTKVQLDYYQLCALRTIVNGYTMRKEPPTLGKILAAAKEELNYKGGKESLRLILLNKLGIKFKKCEKKNKKPPEEVAAEAAAPQAQNVMPHQQMHEMKTQQMMEMKHPQMQEIKHPQMHELKPMENQCVYTTMIHQIQPVSY